MEHDHGGKGYAAAAIWLVAFACPNPVSQELALVTPVSNVSVEITPSVLTVLAHDNTQPTKFALYVRLWDENGDIIPEVDGYVPSWTASEDWVQFVEQSGHSVVVEIVNNPPVTHEVTVSAEVDGVLSDPSATITVIPETYVSAEDKVLASHAEGNPAAVALVDGLRSDGTDLACVNDEVLVFVRAVQAGNLVWGCENPQGQVVVFATDKALIYQPAVLWQVAQDIVDVAPQQADPLPLPVAMWTAVYDPTATATELAQLRNEVSQLIKDFDVELANDILRSNRVGVELTIVGGFPEPIDGDDHAYTCQDDPTQLTNGVLNIYYVNEILGANRGIYCTRDQARPEDAIYISRGAHSPTSLVHEIGHALSLLTPGPFGHTDNLSGFRVDNLMWAWLDDTQKKNRDHFSLGQAFRMNVDAYSWINHSFAPAEGNVEVVASDNSSARSESEVRLPCQCREFEDEPCPRLGADVESPEYVGPIGGGWRCSDEIVLWYADKNHNAVGLVRGRDWRSAPGACKWVKGLPARRFSVGVTDERLRLWFRNLTPEASCTWYLAVFFDQDRMWYRPVPTDPFPFGYLYMNRYFLADDLTDIPEEPWHVPVNVWFEDGGLADYLAAPDLAAATQVYGGELDEGGTNRTGVTLDLALPQSESDWTETPADLAALLSQLRTALLGGQRTACPLGSSGNQYVTDGVINVYYIGNLTDVATDFDFLEADRGDWCTDDQGTFYVLLAPSLPYSATALAHHLGHVLALDHVTAADDLTWSNVMWSDPYPSGLDARVELTLGQVFRINLHPDSWLNKSSKSPRAQLFRPTVMCTVAPDCPEIGLTIRSEEVLGGGN